MAKSHRQSLQWLWLTSLILLLVCARFTSAKVDLSEALANVQAALGIQDPCENNNCPTGTSCVPQAKACVRAPCPQYSCVHQEHKPRCLKWGFEYRCTRRFKDDVKCSKKEYGCVERTCLKVASQEQCVRRRGLCLARRKVKYCVRRKSVPSTKCRSTSNNTRTCVNYAPPHRRCARFENIEKRGCCSLQTVCVKASKDGECLQSKREYQCTCTRTKRSCVEYNNVPAQCLEYSSAPKQHCYKYYPCARFGSAYRCVHRGPVKCTKYRVTQKCIRHGSCVQFGFRCPQRPKCAHRRKVRACLRWDMPKPQNQDDNLSQARKLVIYHKNKCVHEVAECDDDDSKCRKEAQKGDECRTYVHQYKRYLKLRQRVQKDRILSRRHFSQEKTAKLEETLRTRLSAMLHAAQIRERKSMRRCIRQYRACRESERDNCREVVGRRSHVCRLARFWRYRRACHEARYDCRYADKSTRVWHCHRWQRYCSPQARVHRREQSAKAERRYKQRRAAIETARRRAWDTILQSKAQMHQWRDRCKQQSNMSPKERVIDSSCDLLVEWQKRLTCARQRYQCRFEQSFKEGREICWARYHQQCPQNVVAPINATAADALVRSERQQSLQQRTRRLQQGTTLYHDLCMKAFKDCAENDTHCRQFVSDGRPCKLFHLLYRTLRCTTHMYQCEYGPENARAAYCKLHTEKCTRAGHQQARENKKQALIVKQREERVAWTTNRTTEWQAKCTALVAACHDDDCRKEAITASDCREYQQWRLLAKCSRYDFKCHTAVTQIVRNYYCQRFSQKCEGIDLSLITSSVTSLFPPSSDPTPSTPSTATLPQNIIVP